MLGGAGAELHSSAIQSLGGGLSAGAAGVDACQAGLVRAAALHSDAPHAHFQVRMQAPQLLFVSKLS